MCSFRYYWRLEKESDGSGALRGVPGCEGRRFHRHSTECEGRSCTRSPFRPSLRSLPTETIKRWIEYAGEADGAAPAEAVVVFLPVAVRFRGHARFLPDPRHSVHASSSPRRAGALVPPVWNSWLRGTRHHPPSPEELRHFAVERERVRANVEKLRAEEQKRALLAKAEASGRQEQDRAVSEIES